ncbi:MAG: hypothetical protein AMJ46_10775 [Latescibacteria bacterium DG_63]|nr:MAG: hypothetical protein AMJ46_10775 [Latescibacteria bacterium DG_63]
MQGKVGQGSAGTTESIRDKSRDRKGRVRRDDSRTWAVSRKGRAAERELLATPGWAQNRTFSDEAPLSREPQKKG